MNTINCLLISPPDIAPCQDLQGDVIGVDDADAYLRVCLPKGEQGSPDVKGVSGGPVYVFSQSFPLSEEKVEEFDLLFIVGRHGERWNFPDNKLLKRLLVYFIRENKTVVWLTMLKR